MANSNAPDENLARIWTITAAFAISALSAAMAGVAVMQPDSIREYTQSVLAILFVVGAGFLQVEQPTIDHSVIWAIVGSIVGFYFGAKIGQDAGGTKP